MAAITINFHPDRLLADHRSVAGHLAAEGVYRSQFETGISNGGLGGDRATWEERMFPGLVAHPVYGALNLAGHPDGASPRFGSCHLICAEDVNARATFTLGDSFTLPAFTTLAEIAALAVTASDGRPGRILDDYIEAQIHGLLILRADVTAVAVDPSFSGMPEEHDLRALGVPVRWTPGYRLPAAAFPPDLRGPAVPPLALHIAARYSRPILDARAIGLAAQSVVRDPVEWSAFGSPAETLQLIKYLWHILVILGE